MGIHYIQHRPGMGHAKYLINQANAFAEGGKKVLFLANHNVSSNKVKYYNISEKVVVMHHNDAPLSLDKMETCITTEPFDVVCIELIDNMQIENGKPLKHKKDYTTLFYELKKITKKYNIELYMGRHLPRFIEYRANKKPTLADVHPYERKADTVVGLYRDEVYNATDSDKPNIQEIIDLKTGKSKEVPYFLT